MASCPRCGRDLPPRDPALRFCPSCGATLSDDRVEDDHGDQAPGGEPTTDTGVSVTESVRPPDRIADRGPDPLEGWDLTTAAPSQIDPPRAGLLVAGTAAITGVVGVIAHRSPGKGLRWAIAGAVAAATILRVWELPPEDTTWADGHPG